MLNYFYIPNKAFETSFLITKTSHCLVSVVLVLKNVWLCFEWSESSVILMFCVLQRNFWDCKAITLHKCIVLSMGNCAKQIQNNIKWSFVLCFSCSKSNAAFGWFFFFFLKCTLICNKSSYVYSKFRIFFAVMLNTRCELPQEHSQNNAIWTQILCNEVFFFFSTY